MAGDADRGFLTYWFFKTLRSPTHNKESKQLIKSQSYSKDELLLYVHRAIGALGNIFNGTEPAKHEKRLQGKRIALYVSQNTIYDVILRWGSAMAGYVPVTINWMTDSPCDVAYKLEASESTIVLYDDDASAANVSQIIGHSENLVETPKIAQRRSSSQESQGGDIKERCQASALSSCGSSCVSADGSNPQTADHYQQLKNNITFRKISDIVLLPPELAGEASDDTATSTTSAGQTPIKGRGDKKYLHQHSHIQICESCKSDGVDSKVAEALDSNIRLGHYAELPGICTVCGIFYGDPSAERQLGREERLIVFTSGTTGRPKGAILSHRNLLTSKRAFGQLLCRETQDTTNRTKNKSALTLAVVNPLCHINSSVMVEWSLFRPNTALHLFSKYTTDYWSALCTISEEAAHFASSTKDPNYRVVAPLVSRHLDYLFNIISTSIKETTGLSGGANGPQNGTASHPNCGTEELRQLNLANKTSKPDLRGKLLHALAPREVVLLLGSAPVGPKTLQQMRSSLGDKLPLIRFGSTETSLQVLGTDLYFENPQAYLDAIMAGLSSPLSQMVSEESGPGDDVGYYIGRCHAPFTEATIVKSLEPGNKDFMVECAPRELGYIVCRGANCFMRYVNAPNSPYVSASLLVRYQGDSGVNTTIPESGAQKASPEKTAEDVHNAGNASSSTKCEELQWYTGLGDIGFYLPCATEGLNSSNSLVTNLENDGTGSAGIGVTERHEYNAGYNNRHFYWCRRSCDVLIRGGANYSCESISNKLTEIICENYEMNQNQFSVATIGMKVSSEHDDDCCVTIELSDTVPPEVKKKMQDDFIRVSAISKTLPKGMRPSYVRFAKIPRTFKGAPHTPTLVVDYKAHIEASHHLAAA